MLNKDQITTKLKELGFKEENFDKIIGDVVQVILGKVSDSYLSALPKSEQAVLENLSQDKLEEYFKANKETLPELSAEKFEKIYNETWEDYFKAIAE
jgi:hypothetical protein